LEGEDFGIELTPGHAVRSLKKKLKTLPTGIKTGGTPESLTSYHDFSMLQLEDTETNKKRESGKS